MANTLIIVLLLASYSFRAWPQNTEVKLDNILITEKKSVLDSELTSPIPLSIIGETQITDAGASRAQDILSPPNSGVTLVTSGTKLAASIRGFSSEHTLILIDGQRLANEPTNKFELERIDLSSVERIEIIKGPLSTIYGADALGGVINFISKKGRKDKVYVNLRNATYDAKSPRNSVSFNLNKKVKSTSISVFGTHNKEDPLFYNAKETIDDEKEINNIGGSAHYQRGQVEFFVKTTWSNDRQHSLYYNFLNSSYVYDLDNNKRTFHEGELKFQTGKFKHSAKISNSFYEKEGNTYLQENDVLLMSKKAKINVTEEHYKIERSFDSHLLTAGIQNRQEMFFGNAFNYKDHSKYLPTYRALYLIDQVFIGENIILVPSLRYEDINYFSDTLLGQLGLTYSLDSQMTETVKLNFAQGYRVPTPKDLYVDVLVIKGNDKLVPEKSNSYNLEYRKVQPDWQLQASVFYNQIDNFIQEYFKTDFGKFTYRNVSNVEIFGAEIFTQKMFRYHENSFKYIYLAAHDGRGERLVNRAQHNLVFSTTFPASKKVSIGNDISCRDKELLYNNKNELEEFTYCSVDFSAQYKYHVGQQLQFKLTNLLNEYSRGLPQRPRLVTLSLNAQF